MPFTVVHKDKTRIPSDTKVCRIDAISEVGDNLDLYTAYSKVLHEAVEKGIEHISMPLAISHRDGSSRADDLRVATSAIQDFLTDHELDVYLTVDNKTSFSLDNDLLADVESYIDDHYYTVQHSPLRHAFELPLEEEKIELNEEIYADQFQPMQLDHHLPIDEVVENLDEPFVRLLLRIIDKKGLTDVEVYKRANINRKLFSKIRSNENYTPSKRTALALAIALELTLDETDMFLERAGYALSHAVKFDIIVEYFIINEKYDILEINEVLFAYDQQLLGSL